MKLGLTGLRRMALYFKNLGVSAIMSLTTFNSLLYTIRHAGLEPYREGLANCVEPDDEEPVQHL
jgi:hypothetical protein